MYKQLGYLLLGISALFFAACPPIGDPEPLLISEYEAIYMSKEDLRQAITTTEAKNLTQTGKIYTKGNIIFINERYKGIHIIDNTDPKNPQKKSFINIPGNIDMAIKGNNLYADSAIDLVTLDLQDLNNIKEVSRIENMFPEPISPDGGFATIDSTKGVVVDWMKKE